MLHGIGFTLIRRELARVLVIAVTIFGFAACSHGGSETPEPIDPVVPPPGVVNEVDFWMTTGDQVSLLAKQLGARAFGTVANSYTTITVDETKTFQTVDGFGYTLTGASAEVINSLTPSKKEQLLQELFGSGGDSLRISYLRISIGASDLSSTTFTYDDMPTGQTDPTLGNFSLTKDLTNLIPLLKEILAINPAIKILATPWSAPLWMKDNGKFVGGSLLPQYYDAYARYFVRYINEMHAQGITIDAITPQNEPMNPANNPSMAMSAAQQAAFIRENLGPAFTAAGLTTKIIIYDHNCDHPEYPLAILSDAGANAFVEGSAFHLYAGNIKTLSDVRNAHPDKSVYFTEQYTSSEGRFGDDLKWHMSNVIIGSMRNWSRVALEWNLANNSAFGPNTPGGCTTCKGAITIANPTGYDKNVGYYIIAHASRFVPPGSKRIESNVPGNLQNVAFVTPAGKKVLIVENDGANQETFNIRVNSKWVVVALPGGSVGTFVW